MWMCAFTYVYVYSESSSKIPLLGINSHLLCSELKAQSQDNIQLVAERGVLRCFGYCGGLEI